MASASEGLRMIDQGGVRIAGDGVADKGLKLDAGEHALQAGERKFAKVTLD